MLVARNDYSLIHTLTHPSLSLRLLFSGDMRFALTAGRLYSIQETACPYSTEKIRSRRRRIQFILSLTIETNIEYYSMMTIDTMIRYSMIRMQWRDGGAQSSFSSCVHGQTVESGLAGEEWGHTMHFIRFPVRNFRSSVVYVYVNIVIYARIRLLNLQTTNASHNSYKV